MHRMFSNKKGTDKPIEIFIALFIILAVAMVILKMFSGQIQEKTKELQKIQQKEKFQQAKGDAQRECDEICTHALQNECSIQQKAQFCQHKLLNGLDVNMDGDSSDMTEDLLGGIGVCESAIYCPQVTTCQCQGELNTINCVDILYTYYTDNMGMDVADSCSLLSNRLDPGECGQESAEHFWRDRVDEQLVKKECEI